MGRSSSTVPDDEASTQAVVHPPTAVNRKAEFPSEIFQAILEAQQEADIRNSKYAPNLGTRFEILPKNILGGKIELGDIIVRNELSVVREILHQPDHVIKYEMSCSNTGQPHPLITDYHFERISFYLGLSPEPIFLSPPTPMSMQRGPKTRFTVDDGLLDRCIRRGRSVVRYMVMKRVGECFVDLISDKSHGRFSIKQSARYGAELVRKLQILHENGVIHGDFHCGNVCLSLNDPDDIKIIDFGHARFIDAETDELLRTPFSEFHQSFSPWQFEGSRYARRDDVFKAIFMVAELMNDIDPFWTKLKQLHPHDLYRWKKEEFIFKSLASDPFNRLSKRSLEIRVAVLEEFETILHVVRSLHSISDRIPYDEIIERFETIYSLL